VSVDFSLSDLKQLIIDSLQLEGMTPDAIGDDQPLFGEGLGLDSVDALELVVAIEKRFGTKIHTDDIDPEAFASPSSLLGFIKKQRAEAGQPAG
jgi:acyl carrier protein